MLQREGKEHPEDSPRGVACSGEPWPHGHRLERGQNNHRVSPTEDYTARKRLSLPQATTRCLSEACC